MSQKLFVLHFSPIEVYPPILNLLDFLSNKKENTQVTCLSTRSKHKTTYKNNRIDIKKIGRASDKKITLWFTYLAFNIFNLYLLLVKRPNNVMYFDTISSFPAYVYKRYINKKANLFIHYHEYSTEQEYLAGSPINLFFYRLEQKIYKEAKWISHTNNVRLHKFLTDNNITYNNQVHHINPNYPSKDWGIKNTKREESMPLNLVFVGYSVDPNGCFILELIEWLSTQKQTTVLDIYCLKRNSLPHILIGKQGSTTVNVLDAVAYKDLPPILKNYHVGLILYRGLTPNYIFNAANKLFEYLACDLDVWFPTEMQGCYPYISETSYPKVLKLNFNSLNELQLEGMINNQQLEENKCSYYCEEVYETLYKEIYSV